MLSARARTDLLIYDEIANRRRAEDLGEREDILSMLLAARYDDGTAMSDEEIHDELITMLLAGHDTTATALAWTFDLLLHHPSVLGRLREELAAGEDGYLDAVISESLRVRPVVATSQRVVSETLELDGYRFAAGTTLLSAIWLVHRRADLYPDPLQFRPERFLDVRPPTYEWIPFGGGVRRCIGANFARMEMKVVVKRVIAQAELVPARSELERPRNRVVLLAPRHGTKVIRTA
jgi:cytochrome P450